MWTQYWPIYERLEKEICDFTFQVALSDNQLTVHSIKLAEYVLRICSECENCGKALITQLDPQVNASRYSFPRIGNTLIRKAAFNTVKVEIIWPYQTLSNKQVQPFTVWSRRGKTNPPWFTAYNNLKHDRNVNMQDGNYTNAINALAGLFVLNLWLRKQEIESHSEHVDFLRKRIQSYSTLFNPGLFLKVSTTGSTKRNLTLNA